MADTTTLEVLARMTDVKLNIRDVVDKYLLITYDLPHTQAGDKARRKFLEEARAMGAVQHTESVYLLPWTNWAEGAVLELAKEGTLFVWTSVVTDQGRASEITEAYDESLGVMLDKIVERMDKIKGHQDQEHYQRAEKMVPKTARLIEEIEGAIVRRGSAELMVALILIKRRFQYLS